MTENLAEDIDKDTLVSLLKEKGKEIKSLESKNKKLEERYVKIFRENKNLSKDRETLEKLLLIIFDRDQEKFTNVESGNYELNALTELWNQRQDEKLKLFNETLESHKNERLELEKKLASLDEELHKTKNQTNPEIEKLIESHKARALELENVNHKLGQEIKELSNIIEERNQEISRLRKAEDDIDSLKAELLMKELQIKNINEDLNIKSKIQENERKNEVLRLRQEVEHAQMRIREFEAEKENARIARLNNLRTESTQTEVQEIYPRMNGQSQFENNHSHSPLSEPIRKDSDGSYSQINEGTQVNQEYLKNVILKLFCYLEGNNMKEAKILMNAISIILKMTPEDREKIEEAKRNNTLWSSTVHFLKDTFTAKGDVNYYTSGEQKY